MNSNAPADESPIRALFFGRGAKKAREPSKRGGNTATINKCDN